jgi:omega-6 fatty acid desaturase (delta-12 desaturase)
MSMSSASTATPVMPSVRDKTWRKAVAPYEQPSLRLSIQQVLTSIVPYLLMWFLMYQALQISFWLTFAMAPLAAGFLIRAFIVSHDCGHGSFFKNRRANSIVGSIASTLAFVPYGNWRYQHAIHHATSGDLDRRDLGDVWTLTVEEYYSAPWRKRALYRFYRFPLVMFIFGPIFQFLIANRFWRPDATPKERRSIIRTNIAIAAILTLAHFTIGLKAYAMVQLPIMMFAGTAGVWLFYVQHQFEDVYWERHDQWDFVSQALEGSSFYKLPKVLQWFTGNIGFHHVHHLSPRIPNYYLERAHIEQELFKDVPTLTLRTSFETLKHRLWDEERRELIGFAEAKRRVSAA